MPNSTADSKKTAAPAKAPLKPAAAHKAARPTGVKRARAAEAAAGLGKKAGKKPMPAAKPPKAKPATGKPKAVEPKAANPKPVKAVKPEAAATPAEPKVVRDGFTMPQVDYDRIKSLKALCLKNGVEVKKSELLRAGLQVLEALGTPELLARIKTLAPIKAGRKKNKA